jgi:hypothetical protein
MIMRIIMRRYIAEFDGKTAIRGTQRNEYQ